MSETSDSVHPKVFEYDGAFRCTACGKWWGALPGNPTEPDQCDSQRHNAIARLRAQVEKLQREIASLDGVPYE